MVSDIASQYYRRFSKNCAKIAEPLCELTQKVEFHSTESREAAMTTLKEKLTTALVLAFHSFDQPFTVETDASVGAVLMEYQEDQKLHPVAPVPVGSQTQYACSFLGMVLALNIFPCLGPGIIHKIPHTHMQSGLQT